LGPHTNPQNPLGGTCGRWFNGCPKEGNWASKRGKSASAGRALWGKKSKPKGRRCEEGDKPSTSETGGLRRGSWLAGRNAILGKGILLGIKNTKGEERASHFLSYDV